MVARGTVAAMPAMAGSAMGVVAVDGVATQCAYATADERTGQRIAVEGGSEASTSQRDHGRAVAPCARGRGSTRATDFHLPFSNTRQNAL